MRTVWKYTLGPNDSQTLDIPSGFKILHVGPQRPTSATAEGVQLWIEVSPEMDPTTVTFNIVGTGHPVPQHMSYIGTAVMGDGFVWHVYVTDMS